MIRIFLELLATYALYDAVYCGYDYAGWTVLVIILSGFSWINSLIIAMGSDSVPLSDLVNGLVYTIMTVIAAFIGLNSDCDNDGTTIIRREDLYWVWLALLVYTKLVYTLELFVFIKDQYIAYSAFSLILSIVYQSLVINAIDKDVDFAYHSSSGNINCGCSSNPAHLFMKSYKVFGCSFASLLITISVITALVKNANKPAQLTSYVAPLTHSVDKPIYLITRIN